MPNPGVNGDRIDGPEGYLFELIGGSLRLDLGNTVENRPTEGLIHMPHRDMSGETGIFPIFRKLFPPALRKM